MSNENRTQALDDLDCMLTQFENSFDKENILKKDAIIESTKNNSPLLTNNLPLIKTKAKNSLLLLHKKSKSLYNLANCSTPKVNSLEKEIEYLNVLNETGQLNDSVHESPKLVSPIIRCASSQNQITLSNESLNTPKSNTVVNLNQLGEGLNRKIKFDDETGSETGSQKDQVRANRLETVNEDEEILANLNETENFVKKSKEENVQKQDPKRNLNETKNEIVEKSGFQTASGKILMYNKENVMREDVETSSLKDTIDKSECKIDNLLCSKKDDVVKGIPSKISIGPEKNSFMELSGFQTASGKSLLFKKENILKDIETKMEIDSQKESLIGKDFVSINSSNEFSKKLTTDLSGFQTASGKSLLYKKENIIENDKIKNESACHANSSVELSGFKTASGKGLMYKKDFMLKEHDVQDECDKKPSLELSGFKTASGKGLTFKKDLILKDDLMETESEDKKLEISGFKTASGKGLTFKKDLVLKDDLMGSESNNKNLEISGFKTASGQNLLFKKDLILKDDETNSNETNSLEMSGFKTATGRALLYKKENIIATPEDSENKPNLIPILKNEIQRNNQEQHFKPVVLQKPNVSSNRMMDGKKFKRPQLIDKSKLNKYVDSLVNETSNKENLVELKEIDNEPKDQKLNIHIFKHLKKELSYLKVKDLNFVKCELKNIQSEGAQFLKNKNGFNLVRPIFEVVKTEILYPMDLNDNLDLISWENKRQLAYDNLTKRLELKKQINLKNGERSKPGYLFEQKRLARESGKNIQLESIKLKRDLNLNNLKKINIDDLENFKFNLSEFEDLFELVKSNGFVQASDSGCLVPDKSLQIGFNEIYNCFLDCKGVDAKLVNIHWYKNHLKWILWKLDAYDVKFDNLFSGTVKTPLNIINQLKYRYDIEIGCARRSSIRKIIEKDDTSINKTLILFLSKVLPSASSTVPTLYVDLCDGWYPIKAHLDTYLSDYVKRGKIKIGDKLTIFSPELLGCPKDGCDPLEAPEDMHFKLSVNSTRKAKWYAKLGYLKPQRPLVVNLNSLKPNSIVGVIDVLIERIYPIMYMEKKPDGSKVYRNQKQEDLLIYSQMKDIENKSSHFDGDFDHSIEDKRKSLEDIKPVNNSFNNNKQVQNVGRRDVTQILKIRVRDYINKNSQEISCLITVWQNAADLYEKIKEGQRVLFFNLTSTTQKNIYQDSSNISLGTNRMTFYKNKKNISSTIASNRVFYEYKDLYESKILNVFNEVDICGIVIKHSSNNYNTLVYLTNLNETNSIVCIGFPKGPELYGFKDVLKISNCVACLNLKFTRKKENLKYPYLIASEMSIFTQKVHALKFLSAQFTQLNELSNKQENKQRLSELAEEINQQPKLSSGSSYENPLNKPSNFKLNTSNTKNNDTKEIKLASIIEASETIPINMKSGLRQPGLVNKPKFLSPAVPRVTESQHNKNQLKRRSDTFELKSNTSLISCDDEDSFISNCDLDSLCKNNSSFNVSMALSESIAKRIKKN